MDDEKRELLLAAIEPNHKSYITVARRRYVGRLEHIADNGALTAGVGRSAAWSPWNSIVSLVQRESRRSRPPTSGPIANCQMANGYHGFSLELQQFNLIENHQSRCGSPV